MSRKLPDPDLILRFQGLKVPDGALGADDLLHLGRLLKGLAVASADLEGGYVSQLQNGSTQPWICFPRRHELALPGLCSVQSSLEGLFVGGGYRKEEGWKIPKEIRDSLRFWAQKNITVAVVIPRNDKRAYLFEFTPEKVSRFSQKQPSEARRMEIKGRLMALDGADNEFELHFDGQKLICPFPQGIRPTGLHFERFVEVLVLVKERPHHGPWKAIATESLNLLPEVEFLDLATNKMNTTPPKVKLSGGFQLDDFFGGVMASDIQVFCDALPIPDC